MNWMEWKWWLTEWLRVKIALGQKLIGLVEQAAIDCRPSIDLVVGRRRELRWIDWEELKELWWIDWEELKELWWIDWEELKELSWCFD